MTTRNWTQRRQRPPIATLALTASRQRTLATQALGIDTARIPVGYWIMDAPVGGASPLEYGLSPEGFVTGGLNHLRAPPPPLRPPPTPPPTDPTAHRPRRTQSYFCADMR